ncbi:LacI family DNA-binding transcriptional regulator [Nocardioides massiliensis]|uniref:LacI family transcriptional regulator n=1 Tax=Nocardioides massiliensis TaxID=1325935 RepID=A0ABT9NP61_9ACTN|nr:LacI family DNA-binding transcriptional regulator [Nocardioides massiliensis]MDP9821645.1 LacI family transcriptional regulator [Nocardioides massiliensis]
MPSQDTGWAAYGMTEGRGRMARGGRRDGGTRGSRVVRATDRRTPEGPATLATVAARAGVSRQTVSNAINNPALLAEDTLAKVERAIADLGYSPNLAARTLRTRTTRLIGLPFEPAQEGTANALMDRFVHTLVEATREMGYHVLLFASDPTDSERGYARMLRSTAVDAFVVTDTYRGDPQVEYLQQRGALFVAFGRPWDQAEAIHPWVDVDGAAGVAQATSHLADRGHEVIAWLGWTADQPIGEDRRAGWMGTMRARGLSTTRLSVRGDGTMEYGRRATHALIDARKPTALVCVSDTVAMGAMRALHERGLVAGRDVAVVGFDDSQVAQTVSPALTSVRQPLEEVALGIGERLEKLLNHRPIEEPGLLLQPTLVVRETS